MSNDDAAKGERLREVRHELSLSARELSGRLGLSPSFISDVENGRTGPSSRLLEGLTNEFGVSASWLLSGQGPTFVSSELSVPGEQETSALAAELQLLASAVRGSPRLMAIVEPSKPRSGGWLEGPLTARERRTVGVVRALYLEKKSQALSALEGLIEVLVPQLDGEYDFLSAAEVQARDVRLLLEGGEEGKAQA